MTQMDGKWVADGSVTSVKLGDDVMGIMENTENLMVDMVSNENLPLLMDRLKFESSKRCLENRLKEIS